MKYTITIKENDEEKYGKIIYEQTVDTLDIPYLISVVNNIKYTSPPAKVGLTAEQRGLNDQRNTEHYISCVSEPQRRNK